MNSEHSLKIDPQANSKITLGELGSTCAEEANKLSWTSNTAYVPKGQNAASQQKEIGSSMNGNGQNSNGQNANNANLLNNGNNQNGNNNKQNGQNGNSGNGANNQNGQNNQGSNGLNGQDSNGKGTNNGNDSSGQNRKTTNNMNDSNGQNGKGANGIIGGSPTHPIYDVTSTQTFNVYLSDGHEILTQNKITFNTNSLSGSENLKIAYQTIETSNGKKCSISKNLPILPIKFVESKIYNPNCVIRFKQSNNEVYLGTNSQNCVNEIQYISDKLTQECLLLSNGVNNQYSQSPSDPKTGSWIGYSYVFEVNGPYNSKDPQKIFVTSQGINLGIKDKPILQYGKFNWRCNEDGNCDLKKYMEHLKNPKDLTKSNSVKEAIKTFSLLWNLVDYNHCIVIELQNIYIVCPHDFADEHSLKLAIAVSLDLMLKNSPATDVLQNSVSSHEKLTTNALHFKQENNQANINSENLYDVVYATDKNPFFNDTIIQVTDSNILSGNGQSLVKLDEIEALKGVSCGIEFRDLSLPAEFHEFDTDCCFRITTNENHYFCTIQQSKCYIPLRRMILNIREKCLNLQKPLTNGKFEAEATFAELNFYKEKGEVTSTLGHIIIEDGKMSFLNNQKSSVFNINLLTLQFICKDGYVCTLGDYTQQQKPFLDSNFDKVWFNQTISNFLKINPKNKPEYCLVIHSTDSKYFVSKSILTCSETQAKSNKLREAIIQVYNQKINITDPKSPEFDLIPLAFDNTIFEANVISITSDNSDDNFKKSVSQFEVMPEGIIYVNSRNFLVKNIEAANLASSTPNIDYTLYDKDFPSNIAGIITNKDCCFRVITPSKTYIYICPTSRTKCYFQKATIYKTLATRAAKTAYIAQSTAYQNIKGHNFRHEDPFTFGVKPNFNKFKDSEIEKLKFDTFDNSKNGIWEGYVYENSITERKLENEVNIVYARVGGGLISFYLDVDDLTPYKTLNLKEYDQICRTVCSPEDYINEYKNSGGNYEDITYVSRTIEDIMGKIKYPVENKSCAVLDFVGPIYQFGHSHIICTVEMDQGKDLKHSIQNSYYNVLLTLNIEKDIRTPYGNSDQYIGKLFINETLDKDHTIFNVKNGNLYVSNNNDKNNKFNISLDLIKSDNFNSSCAIWYKGLNLKEKSEIYSQAIGDDNCCFRFFTNENITRKIEICINHPSGKVCIKESRELMKSIKKGCLKYATNNEVITYTPINPFNFNENFNKGAFSGLVYVVDALNTKSTPSNNPLYLNVSLNNISFYNGHFATGTPVLEFSTLTLQFNCLGNSSCSPSEFLKEANQDIKLKQRAKDIESVFKGVKDAYNIDPKHFDDRCFILESDIKPLVICPYDKQQFNNTKIAIISAYNIRYSNIHFNQIPGFPSSQHLDLLASVNGAHIEQKVILHNRAMYTESGNAIFYYLKLDSNKTTAEKCYMSNKNIFFNNVNNPCCFKFGYMGIETTLCVKEDKICQGPSKRLMKSMWNGCMFSSSIQDKLPASLNSEILGQTEAFVPKSKYDPFNNHLDICPSVRDKSFFDSNKIHKDYIIDVYNDIGYSTNKTIYKGWFNVYSIDIEDDRDWPVLHYYADLSPEAFRFYNSSQIKNSDPVMVIRPDMISISCKDSACEPRKFTQSLSKFNCSLSHIQPIIDSKIALYELNNEKGCVVFENMIDNKPRYYFACIHVKKIRSQNLILDKNITEVKNYTISRNLISSYYGKIVRHIVYDSYLLARKRSDINKEPVANTPIKNITLSINGQGSSYSNVSVTDAGLTNGSNVFLKFSDFKDCKIEYNLIYIPKEFGSQKITCCLRYHNSKSSDYICVNNLNCEYSTFTLAKQINSRCGLNKNKKLDKLVNEQYLGKTDSTMNVIKNVFKSNLDIQDISILNPNKLLIEELTTKHRTIAIKDLYTIKDLMHSAGLTELTQGTSFNIDYNLEISVETITKTTKLTPVYQATCGNFKVTANTNNIVTYETKMTGDKITIIGEDQYYKTKEFVAIVADNSKYIIIVRTENNIQSIIEISSKAVKLLSNINQLSSEFKSKIII